MLKKIISILISVSILLSTAMTGCAKGEISVLVNGEAVQFDSAPIIKNGRTLVPFRAIFEKLGAEVSWEAETQRVSAVKDDTRIHLFINQRSIYINDAESEIDAAPIISGGRTLVPLRAVSEALDCIVTWSGTTRTVQIATDLSGLEYSGEAYVTLNSNMPELDLNKDAEKSYENYSELDYLGRAGVAEANVGLDIMPTEERGSIGSVKPTGWQTVKYDFVDGKYLYNRCHLIGYQLTGENANERNLITGTRYMNVDGMLPFENTIAEYVKESGNHVFYRVTPIYDGDNLLASGVKLEAYSPEDNGKGVCFNVYCFNVQPGVDIDYKTGNSALEGQLTVEEAEEEVQYVIYILNINSMKFHYPDCSGVKNMNPQNKRESGEARETLVSRGYSPCGLCKP